MSANKPTRILNLRRRVKLRAGRGHSLKSHAHRGTLLREVLGILDLLAAKDPQRFVYASMDGILKLCNKGSHDREEQYTLRWLKMVFAELWTRHIISSYFTTLDGAYGFVVARHDSLCYLDPADKHTCIMELCGAEERLWTLADHPKRAESSPPSSPASSPDSSPASSPPSSPDSSPAIEKKFTTEFTTEFTSNSPQTDEKSEHPGEGAEPWNPVCLQIGTPSLGTCQSLSPGTGLAVGTGRDQSNDNSKTENRADEGSSLSGLTDQNRKPAAMTIGETLGGIDDWLAAVSDGELNSNSADEWLRNGWLSKEELRALRSCVCAAIDDKRDLPFHGRITQAQLMGDAMKLLSDVHKIKAPKPWVPVIKHLRASPGPSRVGAPDLPTYDVCRQELNELCKRPLERDYEKCKALGLEPCADGIWRPPEGRADKGYTVKGDDGVWRQKVSSSENGQGVTR